MGVVFGLIAAVLYGSGDYFGGRASDGGDVRRVMVATQLTALVVSIVGLALVRGDALGKDFAYGAAAGVTTAVGLGLLYRGLAIGRAGVVAPITAVVGAMVPVVWGLATGERPSALSLVGVVVAVGAAGLIARGHDEAQRDRSGAGIALAAGLVLGTNFVLYAATSKDSGLWPLLPARFVAIAVAAGAVVFARDAVARVRLTTTQRNLAVAAGACDIVGTFALLAGVRTDLAVLVAATTALAPGFTVVWAVARKEERIAGVQAIGVGFALVGLVMIAAG